MLIRRRWGAVAGVLVSAGTITNVPPRPEQALWVQRVQAGVPRRDRLAGILTAGSLPAGSPRMPNVRREAVLRYLPSRPMATSPKASSARI